MNDAPSVRGPETDKPEEGWANKRCRPCRPGWEYWTKFEPPVRYRGMIQCIKSERCITTRRKTPVEAPLRDHARFNKR